MKNDLTCAVVRDLLPSYVEGLTSAETNRAVDAHLSACADCTARKRAMTAPETSPKQGETVKEVDYLKKVKRRRWKWTAGAVFCTLALVAAGFAVNTFAIGREAVMEDTYNFSRVDEETRTFYLNVDAPSSGTAYWGWKTEEKDGVVTVTARQGPVSLLHKAGCGRLQIPLDGIHEIYLCGQLIYQDGMVIKGRTADLYNARTPYAGDAAALGALAQWMDFSWYEYTMSLQTSERPYGWTIAFTGEGIGWAYDRVMRASSLLMLALVDNLEQVSWTYTEDGALQTHTITLEQANALLPQLTERYNRNNGTDWVAENSVKDYMDSVADFQRLYHLHHVADSAFADLR